MEILATRNTMMDKIQSTDVRGDVYEYLLSKIAQSGVNG